MANLILTPYINRKNIKLINNLVNEIVLLIIEYLK